MEEIHNHKTSFKKRCLKESYIQSKRKIIAIMKACGNINTTRRLMYKKEIENNQIFSMQ
jgi:hypothetical protein